MTEFGRDFFPEVTIHRIILGEVGPQFIPEWPEAVDPLIYKGPLEAKQLITPVESEAKVVDALGLGEHPDAFPRFRSCMDEGSQTKSNRQ